MKNATSTSTTLLLRRGFPLFCGIVIGLFILYVAITWSLKLYRSLVVSLSDE